MVPATYVHLGTVHLEVVIDGRPLIASHAPIDDRSGIEQCRFRVDPMALGVLWLQTKLARIAADVLWCPHGTLPLASRVPAVISMHDLTTITMPLPHEAKTLLSFNLFVGRSTQRAEKITSLSP